MKLDELRGALRSGELYKPPPPPRWINPMLGALILTPADVVNMEILPDHPTEIELVGGKIEFERHRRVTQVGLELTLNAGRMVGSYWGQGAVRLEIRCPPNHIIAQALKYEPIWVPGIEGEREPTPANGACYRITAEVISREIDVAKMGRKR